MCADQKFQNWKEEGSMWNILATGGQKGPLLAFKSKWHNHDGNNQRREVRKRDKDIT